MQVPLSWLKEYITTERSAEEIAETLTLIGLEVDALHPVVEGGETIDWVFEIALTPNLVHCASIYGVARELSIETQEILRRPVDTLSEKGGTRGRVKVSIENHDACPRYACRLIENVRVGASPAWLKERIGRCGLRSVNNIVDITNYVLQEFGHPLHAFDFGTIDGGALIVRNAKAGERIETLDGKVHYPTGETLLICDAQKAVAIAGIMGSKESEVSERTQKILLESAYFDPVTVRRAAKRMELHTEASYHFERGVDPNGLLQALDKAALMMEEIANGRITADFFDIKEREFLPASLSCRLSATNRLLGLQLAMGEIETLFQQMYFSVKEIHGDTIQVEVPTYRQDIKQEIDLIEEIARFYGYENIRKREKMPFRLGTLPHAPAYLFEKKVRGPLLAEGLQEFLTCDLISPEEAALLARDSLPSRALISLLNPVSREQSTLRASLLPGLLKVVKLNRDHEVHSVAGFELGRVHFKMKEEVREPSAVGIVLAGYRQPHFWAEKEQRFDFYDLKGIVENLLEALKIKKVSFLPSHLETFHPHRQASLFIEEVNAGTLGELHPLTLQKCDLTEAVLFAEINLEDLQRFTPAEIKMRPLPLFPLSIRDWTVTLPESYPIGKLLDKIRKEEHPLLDRVMFWDLYRSEKLGPTKKNATFRFVYRDLHKTISMEQVEEAHQKLTQIEIKEA
jgi:phenylalanyl-tRNA synthetase beta chain